MTRVLAHHLLVFILGHLEHAEVERPGDHDLVLGFFILVSLGIVGGRSHEEGTGRDQLQFHADRVRDQLLLHARGGGPGRLYQLLDPLPGRVVTAEVEADDLGQPPRDRAVLPRRAKERSHVATPVPGHLGQDRVVGLSRAGGLVVPPQIEIEGLALVARARHDDLIAGRQAVKLHVGPHLVEVALGPLGPAAQVDAHPESAEGNPTLAAKLDVEVGQLVLLPLLPLAPTILVPV